MRLIFSLVLLSSAASAADCSATWWDRAYAYRDQVPVTNHETDATPVGRVLSVTFNHAALVTAGKSLASGDDLRLLYCGDSGWEELDRVVDSGSAWNASNTKIIWRNRVSIPEFAGVVNGAVDSHSYWVYYGNRQPVWNSRTVTTLDTNYSRVKRTMENSLGLIVATLPDGVNCWGVHSAFPQCYLLDQSLAMVQNPGYFTAAQVRDLLIKYMTPVSGSLPSSISNTTGSPTQYYILWQDVGNTHNQGDTHFLIPILAKLYYDKTGDISFFVNYVSTIEAGMATGAQLTRDANAMIVANNGDPWLPQALYDSVLLKGNVAMGCLYDWLAYTALASLETAAGRTSQATTYTAAATNIATRFLTTFKDATTGMIVTDTINNVTNLDIWTSAKAVKEGLITGSDATTISNWFVTNLSSIEGNGPSQAGPKDGFLRKSPTNWTVQWSSNNCCGLSTYLTYDNGWWPYMLGDVLYTINLTSPSTAIALATRFATGTYIDVEGYGTVIGYYPGTHNLGGQQGALWWMRTSGNFPTTTTTVTGAPSSANITPNEPPAPTTPPTAALGSEETREWSNGYTYRRSVKINPGMVTKAQTDYPLTFYGTYSYLKTKANGGNVSGTCTQSGIAITVPCDLSFTSDSLGVSALNWEVAKYDATTGEFEAHIKLATIVDGTTIYLFYGKPSVTTWQGGTITSVWDSNYKAVYHIPDGSSLQSPTKDSTSNANHCTWSGSPTAAVGKIDGGVGIASNASFCVSGSNVGLSGAVPVTVSVWARVTSNTDPGGIAGFGGSTGTTGNKFFITGSTAGNGKFSVWGEAQDLSSGVTSADSAWHYIVGTYELVNGAGTHKIYIDGAEKATVSPVYMDLTNAPMRIGKEPRISTTAVGTVDEVRLSNIARSADWILATYRNQSSPSTFYAIGAEQTISRTSPM